MSLLGKNIDIVYLWVDGQDEKWKASKEHWSRELNVLNQSTHACRFRDNEELRYSLRSLYLNAPWIRNIFIVTNGQIPKWLDTSNPKIRIVNHSEIMPESALPTFNSSAIEASIFRIPDLSDLFLLANDDTFFGKLVSKDYFFCPGDDLPILRQVHRNWSKEMMSSVTYCSNVEYAADLISSKFNKKYCYESHHNIDAYSRREFEKAYSLFPELTVRTIESKFRKKQDLQRSLVNFYMLATNKCHLQLIGESVGKMHGSYVLGISGLFKMEMKLLLSRSILFCLNDNENTKQSHLENIKVFLESVFPTRAPWEKDVPKFSFIEKVKIFLGKGLFTFYTLTKEK